MTIVLYYWYMLRRDNMSIQLENFTISRLVIHEIYKRDATGAVPPAL